MKLNIKLKIKKSLSIFSISRSSAGIFIRLLQTNGHEIQRYKNYCILLVGLCLELSQCFNSGWFNTYQYFTFRTSIISIWFASENTSGLRSIRNLELTTIDLLYIAGFPLRHIKIRFILLVSPQKVNTPRSHTCWAKKNLSGPCKKNEHSKNVPRPHTLD